MLKEKETAESSSDQIGERGTNKANIGFGSDVESETCSEHKPEFEADPKSEPEPISNSAIDPPLVASIDAVAEKDHKQIYPVQLLNFPNCEQEIDYDREVKAAVKKRKLENEESADLSSNQNYKGNAKKAKTGTGTDIKTDNDDERDASSNARTEPEPQPISKSASDSSLVTSKNKLNVCDAVPEQDYSQLDPQGELVQFSKDPDCEQEFHHNREVKAAVKKRKLEGEVSTGNEAKRFKTSSGNDVESDDEDDRDAFSDTRSEHKPEPKPEHEPKPISNSVMDFSWVTAEDEADVCDAIAEKDFSRLYLKGERVQLLEKLFENRVQKYIEWKRERDFEREFGFDLDLDFEEEYNNYRETEAPVGERKLKNEVPAGSDAKKANIAAWYDMSSSEDEEDDEQEDRKSDIQQPLSTINSSVEVTSVVAKAKPTVDSPSSSSTHDNTDDKSNDEKNEDQNSNSQEVVNQETSFFYDADAEAKLDEEIGW